MRTRGSTCAFSLPFWSSNHFIANPAVLHQAKQAPPRLEQVRRWATWFPAMGVDIGVPDLRGYRAGARNLAWKRGTNLGGRYLPLAADGSVGAAVTRVRLRAEGQLGRTLLRYSGTRTTA